MNHFVLKLRDVQNAGIAIRGLTSPARLCECTCSQHRQLNTEN